MRIHSDRLTSTHVYNAARQAGAHTERLTEHGSRKRDHAHDVILSGDAPHRINSPEFGHLHAASWDAWGIFLAALFEVDPDATCWAYDDAEDFHRKTGDRFHAASGGVASTDDPRYQRTAHKWAWDGELIVCENQRHDECGAVIVR